jgi:catalase
MLRDGFHQMAVHRGVAPYRPNSLDDGLPKVASSNQHGYVQIARPIEGEAVRGNPVSFEDHFSQAAMFYRSLTPLEQAHIAEAFTFELGKCYEKAVKQRQLTVLAQVDTELCETVASGLGLSAPTGKPPTADELTLSPALSQIVDVPGPIVGRKIGVVADEKSDLAGIAKLRDAAEQQGAEVLVIAPNGGELRRGQRVEIVERTFATARSVEFDAILVAGRTEPTNNIRATVLLQEAYRHCKAMAAWGDGDAQLTSVGIPLDGPGVSTGETVDKTFTSTLVAALGLHRAWERADDVMNSAVPPAI